MASNKKNTEDFIKQSIVIHNGFYDYSKAVYSGKYGKVTIICPIHGEFQQQARCHTDGKGCLKCCFIKKNAARRKTAEVFLQQCKAIHGNTYDYRLVKYIGNGAPVEIICKYHGPFWQKPENHIRGANCQICANYSNYLDINYKGVSKEFLKTTTGYLYVVNLYNEEENFYKVGITKDFKGRFKDFKHYKVDLIYLIKDTLEQNLYDERLILNEFKNLKYSPLHPINGKTECLSVNPILYYHKYKENYEIPEKSEYC